MKKDDLFNAYEDITYEERELKEKEGILTQTINLIYSMLLILAFVIIALIIVFVILELDLSAKMWSVGFITFLVGMIIYLTYGSTFRIVKHFSAALFAWGLFFFFLAIWLMPDDPAYDLKKTVGILVLIVIVIIIVLLLLYMVLKKPSEKTRKKKAVKIVMKKEK